jgi:hypothetical protein
MAANGIQLSIELVEAHFVSCLMLYMSDPTSDAFNAAVTQVLQLGIPNFNRPLLDTYLIFHATHINSHLPPQGNMNIPDTTSINDARDQFNALLRDGNVTFCTKKLGEDDTKIRRIPALCWITQHLNTLAFQHCLGDLLKNKSYVPFMIYAIAFFENHRAASSLRHGGAGHHVCAGVYNIDYRNVNNYLSGPNDPHVPFIPIAEECGVNIQSNCTRWRTHPNNGIDNMAGGNLSSPPTAADRGSDAYLNAQPNFEISGHWNEIITRNGMQCWNDLLEWCQREHHWTEEQTKQYFTDREGRWCLKPGNHLGERSMSLFAHLFDYQTMNALDRQHYQFRRIRGLYQNLVQRKNAMMKEITLVLQQLSQGKLQYNIFFSSIPMIIFSTLILNNKVNNRMLNIQV